jgi:electron transport complex protein RnfE
MWNELTKGFVKDNPVFILALGLCPALGVSSQVVNALGMGAGVLFVLVGANIFVSLLKNYIPQKVRIPSYIVIIASFVTIVEMVMQAYIPGLYRDLGVFVSLIVVNCAILGRAEAFANKHGVLESIIDGVGMALGFTFALLLIALGREVLGAGTITLFPVGGFDGVIELPVIVDQPARVFALAPGALLVIGYLIAVFKKIQDARQGA